MLGQTPYGSQDKILTLLTSDYGMLQVIVKNPGGKKSRLAAACEVLAYSELCLLEGRVRYILQSADLEENFFGLREDLSALSLAGYLCELTRHLMPQKENGAEILQLLLNTLYLLEKKKRSPAFLKAVYELKLMGLSGFQPDTDGCAGCGKDDGEMWLLPGEGIALCKDCLPHFIESAVRPPYRVPFPAAARQAFRFVSEAGGKKSSPSSSTPSRKRFSGKRRKPSPSSRPAPNSRRWIFTRAYKQFHIERLDGYFAALKAATKGSPWMGPSFTWMDQRLRLWNPPGPSRALDPDLPNAVPARQSPAVRALRPRTPLPKKHTKHHSTGLRSECSERPSAERRARGSAVLLRRSVSPRRVERKKMIEPKYMKTLELDKILQMLADLTCCDTAREQALRIQPLTERDEVQHEIDRTNDLFQLTARFGTPTFLTLRNPIGRLKIAQSGGSLSCGDLLSVAAVLRQARILAQWRDQWDGEENAVSEQFSRIYLNNSLEREITSAIISEEEVDDNASPELAAIRRKIRNTELRIRDRMDKMIRSSTYQKYLQDAIITMRDGRFVVPVKAEYRSEVPGMVHDTSGSGSTYFVEPASVVEANNEIRVLHAKEKEEIERILAEFSARVGEDADNIRWCFETIIDLNVLFAKANLGYRMKAMAPRITDDGHIILKRARHPLIDPQKVVPIDFALGDDYTTLVITGPNTGGKTVTLKTAGLLTLMAMCGLLIPAADGSSISVFEDILVDIGDEQSIEQSLSTFSAHMVNLVSILNVATYTSLVIIDELGSGTDPVEGAALAVAILEKLRIRGAKVAVTSHYAELKMYALQTDKVENACCEFNVETLTPTYRLLIGVPGKSNAFAISRRLGLDEDIIQNASELVEGDNRRFEEIVDSLEASRQRYEELAKSVEEEKREIDREKAEIDAYKESLVRERDKAEEKARLEAQAIVRDVQRQADGVLQELSRIRKLKDSGEIGRLIAEARGTVKGGIGRMHDAANPIHERTNEGYTLPRALKAGDIVQIYDIDKEAVVLKPADKNGMVLVQAGILKSRVPVGNLRLLNKDKDKVKVDGKSPANSGRVRTAGVSRGGRALRGGLPEIDLRGMNAEEALLEVDQFIDSCVLSGVHQVTIIHGKGTGVLREAVQQHLKKHKSVKSFRLGAYGEGETGVTIAELK